jgi:hypothetical protein
MRTADAHRHEPRSRNGTIAATLRRHPESPPASVTHVVRVLPGALHVDNDFSAKGTPVIKMSCSIDAVTFAFEKCPLKATGPPGEGALARK